MPKVPKVSIITLNWNGWIDTVECLESLYQTDYPNFNIIVVDNYSKDDSILKIQDYCKGNIKVNSKYCNDMSRDISIKYDIYKKEYIENIIDQKSDNIIENKLTIIECEKNYGFAEGNNIGIRFALAAHKPDYVLLLNNDTVVDKKFLSELVKVAMSDTNIGVCGASIFYYSDNNTTKIQSLGGKINWNVYPGYFHIREVPTIDDKNTNDRIECDWISGTMMMIDIKNSPIKFLNSNFFFGCEDIDYGLKMKKLGFKRVTALNSKIWHKGGVSRKKRYKFNIQGLIDDNIADFKFIIANNRYYMLYMPLYIVELTAFYSYTIIKKLVKKS